MQKNRQLLIFPRSRRHGTVSGLKSGYGAANQCRDGMTGCGGFCVFFSFNKLVKIREHGFI